MSNTPVNVTTPVGRLVGGSAYKARTQDAEGKTLVYKSGPNAGQPRVDYFIALAIPKTPNKQWWEEAWGQQIMQVGQQAFPQTFNTPSFAWKIDDGDSQIPNKKGKKPADQQGYPGHWVLKFSGGFAPKIYRQGTGGFEQVVQPDFLNNGDYAEICFNVQGNGSQSQPGVFLNHSMICWRAYGERINFGPDVNAAGFGQSALPQGATMTPPASNMPMPGAAPMGGIPQMPGAAPMGGIPQPVAGIPQMPAMGVPQPVAGIPQMPGVTPNPNFLNVPNGAPAMPGGMPVQQPRAYTMTPAAGGYTREQYHAAGYDDARLIAEGKMLP